MPITKMPSFRFDFYVERIPSLQKIFILLISFVSLVSYVLYLSLLPPNFL